MPHNHRHHVYADLDRRTDAIDVHNHCADQHCGKQHFVVLPDHQYDDLVRRATAYDRCLANVSTRRRAYYAALLAAFADNGYVGRWNADGSTDWIPAPHPGGE